MKMDVFEIGDNKCCLFCNDFLVVKLDKTQFDDCIESLFDGEPYKFKPSFWKPSTERAIQRNTCSTFILNREFEARYRLNASECFFSQNGNTVQIINREIWPFVTKNLEERGYKPFEKKLPPFRFFCEIVSGIALIVIFLLMIFYSDASKFFLFWGVGVGAVMLMHGLQYFKTGDTEITYYKVS